MSVTRQTWLYVLLDNIILCTIRDHESRRHQNDFDRRNDDDKRRRVCVFWFSFREKVAIRRVFFSYRDGDEGGGWFFIR